MFILKQHHGICLTVYTTFYLFFKGGILSGSGDALEVHCHSLLRCDFYPGVVFTCFALPSIQICPDTVVIVMLLFNLSAIKILRSSQMNK